MTDGRGWPRPRRHSAEAHDVPPEILYVGFQPVISADRLEAYPTQFVTLRGLTKEPTMPHHEHILDPFGIDIDLADGTMHEPDAHLVRRASDMRGYYADEAALLRLIDQQHDSLHYEVFEKRVPEERGHLLLCISKLQPGQVGDECFMTKGHYHTVSGTAEVYLCLAGRGLMLMKTADGRCEIEPMARGRMVYVPPHWAHRSINTGDEPLVSFCVYPAEAGHNYGDIATEGFPKRVYLRAGSEVVFG